VLDLVAEVAVTGRGASVAPARPELPHVAATPPQQRAEVSLVGAILIAVRWLIPNPLAG
jgi:hypothetical protein